MFEGVVYFYGPITAWAGRIDGREVIWRTRSRFMAFALGRARARARGLNACHWAVLRDGVIVAGAAPRQGGAPGAHWDQK